MDDLIWCYDYSHGKACIVDNEGLVVVPFFECTRQTAREIVKAHNKVVAQLLDLDTGE